MGEALVRGLLRAGAPGARIRVADPDPARRQALEALGLGTSADNPEVVASSEIVILAVKPDRVEAVLAELAKAGATDLSRPLWVSIAAGTPLARLERALPRGTRIVRAMPNTPALVGEGATAIAANAQAREADREAARAIFSGVGLVWEAPHEGLLDAVTGLSGSGPAYVFVLLEALADAGVRTGLPRGPAQELAVQTVLGAAKLARETGRHPAELKDRVTSPGGTTIAGLARLEARGFRAAILEAVEAATNRSRELAED